MSKQILPPAWGEGLTISGVACHVEGSLWSWPEWIEVLTEEENQLVDSILGKEDSESIILEKFNIPITQRIINCLKTNKWLIDEVIHFLMGMLQERDSMLCQSSNDRVPSFYFTSYFMTQLIDSGKKGEEAYNFKNVKRYSYTYSSFIFHISHI